MDLLGVTCMVCGGEALRSPREREWANEPHNVLYKRHEDPQGRPWVKIDPTLSTYGPQQVRRVLEYTNKRAHAFNQVTQRKMRTLSRGSTLKATPQMADRRNNKTVP